MKTKTVFECESCGYTSSKWSGKCPGCGEWNTMNEREAQAEKSSASRSVFSSSQAPLRLDELESIDYIRNNTGSGELDRVLGGGLVSGSVVLLCGEPGIGKSTLLLQICSGLGRFGQVLYVSGEESCPQLKLRAQRLGVSSPSLYVMTETNAEKIVDGIDKLKPKFVIIDSIQTMYLDKLSSAPGSVTQVKESAMFFINKAKSEGIPIILVGHVNKEGAIAGPKVLEHMVDAVLYFEGDRQTSLRIIRAVKNRFGSTNEVGVFDMDEHGLTEVPNPSAMLLSGRPLGVSGNCTVCTLEGTRPILAEIQSLVTPSYYPSPKRTASGLDVNRVCLLLALLEKRMGLRYSSHDVYMNVIGGLRIDDTASDLPTALSLVSGLRDIPFPDDTAAFGELGLSGECRPVSNVDTRIKECAAMGFKKIILPFKCAEKADKTKYDTELIGVKSIYEAIRIFGK